MAGAVRLATSLAVDNIMNTHGLALAHALVRLQQRQQRRPLLLHGVELVAPVRI